MEPFGTYRPFDVNLQDIHATASLCAKAARYPGAAYDKTLVSLVANSHHGPDDARFHPQAARAGRSGTDHLGLRPSAEVRRGDTEAAQGAALGTVAAVVRATVRALLQVQVAAIQARGRAGGRGCVLR